MSNAAPDLADIPHCPSCGKQMHLFGIEWETEARDLYTFMCERCDHYEVRGLPARKQ